jgi:hypothetical protein
VSILNKISRRIARSLPESFFYYQIAPRKIFLGDSPQRFDMDRIYSAQNSSSSSTQSLMQLFNSTGEGRSTIEKGYWSGIREASPNSVAGYVPYIKNETKLLIYNFWSMNYGLRKQLLGHISLIQNRKFILSYKISIPSGFFHVFDLNKLFDDEDGEVVFVDLFHPRLPKNHGGHDGHLRFWGIYGNSQATCHSMPFPMLNFHVSTVQSCRATLPAAPPELELSTSLIHWSGKRPLPAVEHFRDEAPFGYYASKFDTKIPTTVWHAAAFTGTPSNDSKNNCQLVALPPIAGIDVQLSFVEAIKSESQALFSLHDFTGSLISKIERPISPHTRIKASEVFPGTHLAGNQLLVTFPDESEVIHHGYLHLIYYSHKTPADCVHSHRLDARKKFLESLDINDKSSTTAKGQSLKFMHFPTDGDFISWLAVWTFDDPLPIKLRLIDDAGNEFVQNSQLPGSGVHYIDLNSLVASLGALKSRHFVVQLQSDYGNFNANLFTSSEKSKSISVDHLTGG